MGKRCLEITNGKPCPYLANDGSCLLSLEDMPERCPAKETLKHEEKDDWIKERHQRRIGKTNNGINVWSLEKQRD
jgi:hypothetical protein